MWGPKSAPAEKTAHFCSHQIRVLHGFRAPRPAQFAARPARPPAAYGAHPAPPEPENGAPRARDAEFSSKSHHLVVAPSSGALRKGSRGMGKPPTPEDHYLCAMGDSRCGLGEENCSSGRHAARWGGTGRTTRIGLSHRPSLQRAPSNPPALGLGFDAWGHFCELAGAVGERGATPCTDGRPSENTPA